MSKIIHLNKWYFRQKPQFHNLRDGAACGNGSAHAYITNKLKDVNCPECYKTVPDVWKSKIKGDFDE